jgi:hypothetical protein
LMKLHVYLFAQGRPVVPARQEHLPLLLSWYLHLQPFGKQLGSAPFPSANPPSTRPGCGDSKSGVTDRSLRGAGFGQLPVSGTSSSFASN